MCGTPYFVRRTTAPIGPVGLPPKVRTFVVAAALPARAFASWPPPARAFAPAAAAASAAQASSAILGFSPLIARDRNRHSGSHAPSADPPRARRARRLRRRRRHPPASAEPRRGPRRLDHRRL